MPAARCSPAERKEMMMKSEYSDWTWVNVLLWSLAVAAGGIVALIRWLASASPDTQVTFGIVLCVLITVPVLIVIANMTRE